MYMNKNNIDINEKFMKMSFQEMIEKMKEFEELQKENRKLLNDKNKLNSELQKTKHELKIQKVKQEEDLKNKNYYHNLALPIILKGAKKVDRNYLEYYKDKIITCICPTTKQINFLEILEVGPKNTYIEAYNYGEVCPIETPKDYDIDWDKYTGYPLDTPLHYRSENYVDEIKKLESNTTYKLYSRYIVLNDFDFSKNPDKTQRDNFLN